MGPSLADSRVAEETSLSSIMDACFLASNKTNGGSTWQKD